jgi:hypothetical protein
MNIKELQEKVYRNTLRLGYSIDKKTTIKKLKEELNEFRDSGKRNYSVIEESFNILEDEEFLKHFNNRIKNTEYDEIPDMFFVILSYCEKNYIDFETLVKNKLRYNSLRDPKCPVQK